MYLKLVMYSFGVWLLSFVFFILNGAFREFIIVPNVGEWGGHIISSLIGIGILFLVSYLLVKYLIYGYSTMDLVIIGLFWLLMTIVFEFVFGHYVMGHSWNKLLADYNILKGRIWVLVLLMTFLAPIITGIILKK